mgnify:CR=1 FL=1
MVASFISSKHGIFFLVILVCTSTFGLMHQYYSESAVDEVLIASDLELQQSRSLLPHFEDQISSSSRQNLDDDTVVLERKPRRMAVVHIGKAGGMTLRWATGCSCYKRFTAQEIPGCFQKKFKNFNNTFGYETRSFMHMRGGVLGRDHGIDGKRLTSYVVTLRNPIDRLVSAYRFNHPESCSKEMGDCVAYNAVQPSS